MSCYYPNIAFPTGRLTDAGKPEYKIVPASTSVDPVFELKRNDGSILVPCGKCKGCRIDYSRRWADRMMLELETSKAAIFVTLTYDNEHVNWKCDDAGQPIWMSLNRRDWQLFMKRLRKHFDFLKIRFFMCGEYGEKTIRPHMHAILFGVGLNAFSDLEQIGRNRQGQCYYKSDMLRKIWSCGNVLLADVSWETCAYVARYVVKKQGNNADYLEAIGVEPEFCLMSRRPGLGAKYLEDHPDALDNQYINVSTPTGGRKIAIPRFYIKKKELTDPQFVDMLKEQRRKYASDSMLLKLSNTDLDFFEFLDKEEAVKKKQTVPLMRNAL